MNDQAIQPESVVSAIRWSGAIQIAAEGTRILTSVFLARLLAPEDFGLLAMASVITGFLVILQYMGTRGVIIQRKELSAELINSLFTINLVLGVLLAAGLLWGASALAAIFKTDQVAPVIRALGIAFIISSFGGLPGSLIARRMRFDLMARVKFVEIVVYSVVAIGCAASGLGVWALVTASLAGSSVSTVLFWFVSRWKPRWTFRWNELRKVAAFSLNLTGSSLVEYSTRNVDRFILGRWLGSVLLGHYSIACRFCLFPLETIAPVLMRVLFPAMSRLQDDPDKLKRIFLRACGGIAFFSLPLMAGLAILAGPFVLTVLGIKWKPVIPLLILLSPVGLLRSVTTPVNEILLALGRSDWLFRLLVVSGILLTAGFFCGLPWGINGVAAAYVIVTLPLTVLRFALSFRLVDLRFSDLLISLRPYVLATAAMAGFVFAGKILLEGIGLGNLPVLVACVLLGGIVYLSIVLLIRPPALIDFLRVLPGGNRWLEHLSGQSREIERD
jgi:O-antigen/teichoic acid export membrane protein